MLTDTQADRARIDLHDGGQEDTVSHGVLGLQREHSWRQFDRYAGAAAEDTQRRAGDRGGQQRLVERDRQRRGRRRHAVALGAAAGDGEPGAERRRGSRAERRQQRS